MGRIVKPLREMGATIAGRKGGELAPLAVTGTMLRGITYTSPVASAQVKSALLLAALFRSLPVSRSPGSHGIIPSGCSSSSDCQLTRDGSTFDNRGATAGRLTVAF